MAKLLALAGFFVNRVRGTGVQCVPPRTQPVVVPVIARLDIGPLDDTLVCTEYWNVVSVNAEDRCLELTLLPLPLSSPPPKKESS